MVQIKRDVGGMSAIAEQIHTADQGDLPQGWSPETIEQLVGDGGVFVDGDWVESKDQDPEGDVRLIQLADIGDGEYRDKSARFLTHAKAVELGCTFLKKGDVLIARMPDPLGRACIYPGDSKPAVTVVDVAIVRSASGEFDHRWLMYFVNAPAFRSAVASMQSGSTRKRISRGNLAKIGLPVPPLDQQKRIVAEIEKQFSRLDEAVANLKRIKANLKRYRASVLKAAVEGPWPREPLGKIADVHLGKMLDKTKHVSGHRLSYLRNINVRWGMVDTTDLLEMYFEDDELDRFGLKVGDVLVCEGGEPGRAAVWNGSMPNMKYQKAIHRVRFNVPFEPRLLVYLLEHLAKTGRLGRYYTGSTIKHFTRESFIELEIPIPPLAEQRSIVAEVNRRLSLADEVEAQVAAALLRADRLRQSFLAQAFSGKFHHLGNRIIGGVNYE